MANVGNAESDDRKRALIITGGEFYDKIPTGHFDLILAADKGLEYALCLGLTPDYVIGDLDSLNAGALSDRDDLFSRLQEECGLPDHSVNVTKSISVSGVKDSCIDSHVESLYTNNDINVESVYIGREANLSDFDIELIDTQNILLPNGKRTKLLILPHMKDDSDTMACVRFALKQGCGELILTCVFGGRLDHLLANLQTAAFAAKNGARVRLLGNADEIYVLQSTSLTLPRRENYSISVFALSERCGGVTIENALYPLENGELTNSFPLGLSNGWANSSPVTISVREGILAIVQSQNIPQ